MKVRFEDNGSTCRVALSDGPLNILDISMLTDLRDALGRVPRECSLLVISSEGEKAFSAGASVQDHLGDRIETMLRTFHDCFRLLDKIEAVTVALVRGVALGGGCELALACDLVLASDRAKFGQPEINLGVFPPVAAYQLSRQLPPRKGLEMLLIGDSIGAETAATLGIVNAVFPFEEFDSESERWLARLQRQSPSALRHAKKAFRLGTEDDFDSRLARIERLYLDDLMATADATEGLNAFLEKRPPQWKV